MTRLAHRAALALVLAAALCLTAGPGAVGQEAVREDRRVVVVSDSILLGARVPLVSRLSDAGWSVTFDGEQNRTTYAAARVVASHRGAGAGTFVLSLGANDGSDPSTFRQRVASVLAELSDVPRVYWLSLHEVRDGYAEANRVLREAEAAHPNLTVLDWHSLAAADGSLTASDGLHLRPQGASAMAELVAAAVAADPGGEPAEHAGGADDVPAPPPEAIRNIIPTAPEPGSGGAAAAGAGSGGGSGGGSGVSIGGGSGGFGDSYYALGVEKRISDNWMRPPEGLRVRIVYSFYIAANGAIYNVKLETSSGNSQMDLTALRAINASNPLSPPPLEYRGKAIQFVAEFIYPPVP